MLFMLSRMVRVKRHLRRGSRRFRTMVSNPFLPLMPCAEQGSELLWVIAESYLIWSTDACVTIPQDTCAQTFKPTVNLVWSTPLLLCKPGSFGKLAGMPKIYFLWSRAIYLQCVFETSFTLMTVHVWQNSMYITLWISGHTFKTRGSFTITAD